VTPRRGRRPPIIGIVGLGYVGLTTATAFAERGRTVVGYDLDPRRRAIVAAGRAPIHEPSLAPLLRRVVRSGRLRVASDLTELLRRCELVFLCVPTPSRPDGAVDVRFVRSAAESVGTSLRAVRGWRGVVVKSTVTPGTTERLVATTLAKASGRTPGRTLGVASNPEFLAEGTAVRDALHPSRIVLGVSDRRTEAALRGAYAGFPAPILVLSPTAAELVKYASNAMLATRVSFTNEVSRLAEKLGVDVYPVMGAVGLDPRIGSKFLAAGPGFGGSCFTKDLHALLAAAAAVGVDLPVTSATLKVNDDQARHVVELAAAATGSVRGRAVAVLGLAFKPDTDDVRESRAFPIVAELLRRGARVRLHDPAAGTNFMAGLDPKLRARHRRSIRLVDSLRTAVAGADLAVIQADWDEYRRAPLALWGRLRRRLIVDARRTLDGAALARRGIEYVAIGR
jgi:UDPglucose 6-dehydrogenase